jgi:hypothetical protein
MIKEDEGQGEGDAGWDLHRCFSNLRIRAVDSNPSTETVSWWGFEKMVEDGTELRGGRGDS